MRTLHCHFRERHNQFDGVDDLNWVVWGQWRKVQSCQTYVRTKADMVIAFNTICRTRRVKGSCSVSAISSIRMPHPESMLADGLTFTTFTTCTRRSVMAFLTFKLRRAAIGNSRLHRARSKFLPGGGPALTRILRLRRTFLSQSSAHRTAGDGMTAQAGRGR